MVSTPAAVKAFTLKLLELLHLAETGRAPINRRKSNVASRMRKMLGLKRRSSISSFQSFHLNKQKLLASAARAAELLTLWRGAVAVIDEVGVVLGVVLHPTIAPGCS